MSTDVLEFPTVADWERIYNSSPFKELYSLLSQIDTTNFGIDSYAQEFLAGMEMEDYLYELKLRFADIVASYIFTMYYYEKGIPDKRWYVSDGHSIQYFPDFAEIHFHHKRWFNFYSEIFYYKLFSAWDSIGHMMNVACCLGLDANKVHFNRVVESLNNKGNTKLYERLNELKNSASFFRASRIRHDITHNYLPNVPGVRICRGDNPKPPISSGFKPILKVTYKYKGKDNKSKTVKTTKLGLYPYITSDEIVANIQEALGLFAQTIEILRSNTKDEAI